MPTKPRANKKMTLDEAVAKSDWRNRPVSRKRATVAGILGIPFGCLGMHDLIMRHKKRGFIHLIATTIAFGLFFVPFIYGVSVVYGCMHPEMNLQCVKIDDYDDTLNVIMIIGMVLTVASIIWGIVESVIILINRKNFQEK